MSVLQPPAFMAGTFSPPLLRAYPLLGFLQDPASSVHKPLGGIIPRGGALDMGVSAAGSNVTVAAGACVIPGTESSTQYGYLLINDAPMVFSIPTAPVGQTRKDLIVARVRDAAYSGAFNDGDLVLVQGTPATSGAVFPPAPNNALILAEVTQVGTGTPTAAAKAGYTCTPGGIRPARGGTADDAVAPQYAGQYRDVAGVLQRGSGVAGSWVPVIDTGAWTQVTPALKYGAGTAVTLGTGGSAVCRYQVQGKTARIRYHFVFGTSPAGGSGAIFTEPPAGLTAHATGIQKISGTLRVPANGGYSQASNWSIYGFFDPATPTQVGLYVTAAEAAAYLLQFQTGIPIIPSGANILNGTRLDLAGVLELA